MTPEQDIRARAYNAVVAALAEDDRWLPLAARRIVADAVVAAVEPLIRADERARVTGAGDADRQPGNAPGRLAHVRELDGTEEETP